MTTHNSSHVALEAVGRVFLAGFNNVNKIAKDNNIKLQQVNAARIADAICPRHHQYVGH